MFFPVVQDKASIIENGKTMWHKTARETLLKLFEAGLASVNPYSAVKRHVTLTSDAIVLKSVDCDVCSFPLKDIGKIYVVGGGKATASMAIALEEILGDRIDAGFINVPDEQLKLDPPRLKRIRATGASHPLPNQAGVDGVRKMIILSQEARSRDLVFCLISGGGSALMPHPASGITLEDKRTLNKLMIECGATIQEINIVRKHVSMVKGGWLARHFQPARVVGLILSDVVGDDISTIASGPTAPDPSTFSEAVAIIEKYKLLDRIPVRVRKHYILGMREDVRETPKPEDRMFANVTNVIIGSAQIAAKEITRVATTFTNLASVHLLSNKLEGEASEVGKVLHSLVMALAERKSRVKLACGNVSTGGKGEFKVEYGDPGDARVSTLMLLTGETTVTVKGKGTGGRNQELLLSFLNASNPQSKVRFAMTSCGMDGIEGNSKAAGAIIDDLSLQHVTAKGIDLARALSDNDSGTVFSAIGDAIITGPTGTNVNDVTMILVDVPVKSMRAE